MTNRFVRLYILQVLFGLMLVFGWSFAMLYDYTKFAVGKFGKAKCNELSV